MRLSCLFLHLLHNHFLFTNVYFVNFLKKKKRENKKTFICQNLVPASHLHSREKCKKFQKLNAPPIPSKLNTAIFPHLQQNRSENQAHCYPKIEEETKSMKIRTMKLREAHVSGDDGESSLCSILWAADAAHIVTASSSDNAICIHDAASPSNAPKFLRNHGEGVTALALSPNSTCLASGSLDHSVKLYKFPGISCYTFGLG